MDTNKFYNTNRIEPVPSSWQEATWLALTIGVRDFSYKTGIKKAFLGLSGGMDSALVACIATEALGKENVTAILMPSPYTSSESLIDAKGLAANLGISAMEVPIEPLMLAFNSTLLPHFEHLQQMPGEVGNENLQARIRGVLLMAFANYTGGMVLNCGNKSEAAMGYCTLYGDTAGALSVIGDLYKTQVYELADWYCRKNEKQIIPVNIFRKAPSAELKPNQKDTDSLPAYEELDPQLKKLSAFSWLPEDDSGGQLKELARKVASFAFKRRQSPPVLQISGRPLDFQ